MFLNIKKLILLTACTIILVSACTPSKTAETKKERRAAWRHMDSNDAAGATPPLPSAGQDFGACSAKDLAQFTCD